MKKRIFIYLLTPLLFNCSESIETSDFTSVGKAIHESLVEEDTITLKKLYSSHGYSTIMQSIDDLKFEKRPFKIDTSVVHTFMSRHYEDLGPDRKLNLYYDRKGEVVKFSSDFIRDSVGNYMLYGFEIHNLNQECRDQSMTPYTPPKEAVEFKNFIHWREKQGNSNRLTRAQFEIWNHTDFNIENLQVQLQLETIEVGPDDRLDFSNKRSIYSRTFEIHEDIHAGDSYIFIVPELEDQYVSYDQSKLILDEYKLLDVHPRPIPRVCEELAELKGSDTFYDSLNN